MFDKLEAVTGIPAPKLKIPHAVAMLYATWEQTFTGLLLGREPRATVEAVRMGRKKMWASSAKAERDLGWQIAPVEDALLRAVRWFREHGYAN
jgi:dihydroflavonol-4-reductase